MASSRLYIGGLSHDTTEATLCAWLVDHGLRTHAIHLARNRVTGLGRGFAFAEFDEDNGARNAIDALAGFSVAGHMLHLRVV
jgi:RNA recognition motif-containing protein